MSSTKFWPFVEAWMYWFFHFHFKNALSLITPCIIEYQYFHFHFSDCSWWCAVFMEDSYLRGRVHSRTKRGPTSDTRVNIDHVGGRGHRKGSPSPRGHTSPPGPWTKGVSSKLWNCDQASLSSGYETAGYDDSDDKIDLQNNAKCGNASAAHTGAVSVDELSGCSAQVDLGDSCVYAGDNSGYWEPIYSSGRLRYDKETMFSSGHDSAGSQPCAAAERRRREAGAAEGIHQSAAAGVTHKPPLPGGSRSKPTAGIDHRWRYREDHRPNNLHLLRSGTSCELTCNGTAGIATRGKSKQHSCTGDPLVARHESHVSSHGHQRTHVDRLSHLGVETNQELRPEALTPALGQLTQTPAKATSQFSGRLQAIHSSPAGELTQTDFEFYLRCSSHNGISKDDLITRWTNDIKNQENFTEDSDVHQAYHMFNESPQRAPHASMRSDHIGYRSPGAVLNGPDNGYSIVNGHRVGGPLSKHCPSLAINTYPNGINVSSDDLPINLKVYPAIRTPQNGLRSPIITRINECLSDTTQNRLQGECNRRSKRLRKKVHSRPEGCLPNVALWYTSSEEGSGSENSFPTHHRSLASAAASRVSRDVTDGEGCPGVEPALSHQYLQHRSSSLPAMQSRATDM